IEEIFFSDTTPSKEDDLFYNPWSDDNSVAYLADSCNIPNQKAISNIGWENSINDEPHEIYIKLDDLVSQHEATLEKKVSTTQPWWLQPIETSTEAYYREFDNFQDTYLCNLVW
ncbi:1864_t:CDS:2, partial [Gigaspora margarita]